MQHGNFFRHGTRRAILWTLVVGSGLAAGLLGTSAIAQHAQGDNAETAEASGDWRNTANPFLYANRGFAFSNGRLFRGTSDAHVVAPKRPTAVAARASKFDR